MAGDIIAVVESPKAEAVIYANARAESWRKPENGVSISQSPLPVFPVQSDADGESSALLDEDEDVETIKARAEAEAAAGASD
jgi:hypothetical protein